MLDPLYTLLDVALCRERGLDPLAVLHGFLDGGARLVQLRDKTASSASRLALADTVVARAHAAGATLIVNDRADIAAMSGADGVHVGQEDFSVHAARLVVGNSAMVGISTHDVAQVAAAADTTATYIAVGTFYGTSSKVTGYSARGLDLVRVAAQTGKPVVAIGGITLERAPEVIAAGAVSVAVISDLLRDDPAAMVRRYRECLAQAADGR
jgi:thiamine-phosphate pyrophosphorylase